MTYKTINYLKDNQTIETFLINGEIWLSKKAMSLLYKKTVMTISNYVQKIGFCGPRFKKYLIVNKNNKTTLYDVNTVLEIGKMLGYYDMSDFENWVNAQKGIKVDNNYQIFRYNRNNLTIDVKVSPEENTVWVTQDQLAEILDTTQPNISMHINNIYASKELERGASYKDFLYVQNINGREVKRQVGYYNLDMIISVAYRVNSRNGILFRQWATKVLKEVLINGYKALNDKEVTWNDFTNLAYKVDILKQQVDDLMAKESKETIFKDGEFFKAYDVLRDIVVSANKSIVLIDNYADDTSLSLLSNKKRGVLVSIITTLNKSHLTEKGFEAFNKQHGKVSIYHSNKFHDRIFVIDMKDFYSIGTSLNSAGDRISLLLKIESPIIRKTIVDYITKISL